MGGWALLPRVSDRKTGRIVRSCFAELFGTFSVVFWGAGAALDAADATKTLHLAFGFGIGRHSSYTTIHHTKPPQSWIPLYDITIIRMNNNV